MTGDREPSTPPKRRSLRRRVVATFAGLTILPFALTLAVLYFVAREDIADAQGNALAQEARLLAAQIRLQILSSGLLAGNAAQLPEVQAYVAGEGAYPEALLAALQKTFPGLRSLKLDRTGAALSPRDQVSAPIPGRIDYRIPVTRRNQPKGVLTISQDLRQVHQLLDTYRRGGEGRAVLVDSAGRLLAGPAAVAIPPLSRDLQEHQWGVFRSPADGASLLVGAAAVDRASPLLRDWTVLVVQPGREIFASFQTAVNHTGMLLLLLAGIGLALAWHMGNQFFNPIAQLRQGAEIISRINLGHRLQVHTGDELEGLAEDFNRMAESLQGAYDRLEERVRESTVSLQEERNRLAAVLRTMVEGVVVTNEGGEVLLMNPRARLALDSGPSSGIGAPLARILPAARLEFHFRRLRAAAADGRDAVEQVVFPLPGDRLLRGLLSPVQGPDRLRAGFLFVFRDVSLEATEEERARTAARELPELIKGPIATLQSLAEVLDRRPDMPDARRKAFLEALREEAGRLADRLRAAEEAAGTASTSRWPSLPADPAELVREAVSSVQGVFVHMELPPEAMPPVLVEPFSWVCALSAVLRWVAEKSSGWAPVEVLLAGEEDTIVTTFRLQNPSVDPAGLEEITVAPPGEATLPLGEAVRRNRGELWTRKIGDVFEVRLALLRASAAPAAAPVGGIADGQPEFYDFDLFLPRPVLEPESLQGTRLQDLDCVIFDTETTGLNPSQGDEIISLGAIRVRGGRVMGADTFDTLVNPGRPIPPQSTQIHHIDDEAVSGAPTIAEVLPRFREYVGGSVLVAHNAAFDLKFIDIAAGRLRQPRLENPVLDTLFLSYGIHRDFEGHHLDAIAQRLGVAVVGRHTSLGDARTTAEVFLRLIPLLASRGVSTLVEAKRFCDRMLLLRWQASRF